MMKINPEKNFESFISEYPVLNQTLTEESKKVLFRLYRDAVDWTRILDTTTSLMWGPNNSGIDYYNDYNKNLERKIAADKRLESAMKELGVDFAPINQQLGQEENTITR